ncbi:MAG: undecaprenyl/decaprenyl-phosphate alpha-N-acetylglucosaminyl 1-phosphate transferase [Phycisphaerae bacterium]|nr:undecaprenyl/decaprenyl-phosphate alpha-N-acetylglucosaminyl 1-phosphate transferase [Phycisphaerae bacterium]
MKTYIVVYLGAMTMALLLTPLVIFVARALNIYDDLDVRKVHAHAMPRIGGVAIAVAMLGMILPVLFLNNMIGDVFRNGDKRILVFLAACFFVFLVGLTDDLVGLRVRTKFLGQFAAALTLCLCGIRVDEITLTQGFVLELGWIAWPFTLVWIIGITNAINLIDGLDGLAAGIAAMTSGVIALFCASTNQPIMAVIMLAMMGSLSGFIFYNYNPARIFMGDGGSLFLGFTLAASCVMCLTPQTTITGMAWPILAMGIPIFDTLFSMLRRFLERRSMFSPDRSHFHHRLLDMGLQHKHAVIVMHLVTLFFAAMGTFLLVSQGTRTLMIFGANLVLLILVFRFVGAVRLFETLGRFRQKQKLDTQGKGRRRDFEKAQLAFRRARTFDQWWQAVQAAADQMQFAWIVLRVKRRNGIIRTMLWRQPTGEEDPGELLDISLPIRQRRRGETLRLSLSVRVAGSLESAGHRVALFSRLVDEYSLKQLSPESGNESTGEKKVATIIEYPQPEPFIREKKYEPAQLKDK